MCLRNQLGGGPHTAAFAVKKLDALVAQALFDLRGLGWIVSGGGGELGLGD